MRWLDAKGMKKLTIAIGVLSAALIGGSVGAAISTRPLATTILSAPTSRPESFVRPEPTPSPSVSKVNQSTPVVASQVALTISTPQPTDTPPVAPSPSPTPRAATKAEQYGPTNYDFTCTQRTYWNDGTTSDAPSYACSNPNVSSTTTSNQPQ